MSSLNNNFTREGARRLVSHLRIGWAGETIPATLTAVLVDCDSCGIAVLGIRLSVAADDNKLEATIDGLDVRSKVRRDWPNCTGAVVSWFPVEDDRTARAWSSASLGRQRWPTARPLPNFSLLERCDVARVDGDAIIDARKTLGSSRGVVECSLDCIAAFVQVGFRNDAVSSVWRLCKPTDW